MLSGMSLEWGVRRKDCFSLLSSFSLSPTEARRVGDSWCLCRNVWGEHGMRSKRSGRRNQRRPCKLGEKKEGRGQEADDL